MSIHRNTINFGAGPAQLPIDVLNKAKDEFLDYNGSGISIMEMSHRSADFQALVNAAKDQVKKLMCVPDNYEIVFMQGGGSAQFAAIPLNIAKSINGNKAIANYLVTGTWSQKAAQEAKKYVEVNLVTPATKQFLNVPDASTWNIAPDASYFYYCANETVHGIEIPDIQVPEGTTLVADVSSNIMTRNFDVSKHGIVYAGAQKNLGIPGVTVVIIRKDLIGKAHQSTPRGSVICMDSQSSSVVKGESLEDTVMTMSRYTHLLVLRHPEVGSAERAVKVSEKPVINAGDGAGQHPTQALLDIFTIRNELGTVNNLTIALVGDLKNGRTVHSLAKLLCVYSGITLHFVSPVEELGMPSHIVEYVKKHSNFVVKVFNCLEDGIKDVDVVYMTRVQKERFSNAESYEAVKGKFILTPKILNDSRTNETEEPNAFGPQRELPIVLHPLPRVDEISTELDHDQRAAYFRQMDNGVYVRMAILALILKGDQI
uniref:Aspartate carbamoyltransferase n=1 Tax=Rhabditophanes sp. KR3021 TaxID=114890 RepID=A0AC35TV43_9BILA